MTVEEAEARAKGKELPDDMDFDDGKMFKKVDKGEMSLKSTSGYGDVRSADRGSELELLAKKNPSLARFVSLGRFAQVRNYCLVFFFYISRLPFLFSFFLGYILPIV